MEETVPKNMMPGNETILIVDDNDLLIDVMREMLSYLGYEVLFARSGREAVKIYGEHQDDIDLVIPDMIMPGLNGGETFQILQGIDPHVRVVLSSGYGLNDLVKTDVDRGIKAFLQKPYSLKELSQKITEAFEAP